MKSYIKSVVLIALISVTACTNSLFSSNSGNNDGSQTKFSFNQFSDIPLPEKANMDTDRTLLLSYGEDWLGRLIYSTSGNTNELYDLYKSNMSNLGWQEFSSVRSAISIQTWQRGDRVAIIQIKGGALGFGSEISIIMSTASNNISNENSVTTTPSISNVTTPPSVIHR
ncbi:MAG: hypothetical protein LBS66_02985 [Rhodospirillaceae bacterium]|jgi:predicted Abi (CAAX) family protease|nr:hypothetical protein [Rhodospirillaceae bacterium]